MVFSRSYRDGWRFFFLSLSRTLSRLTGFQSHLGSTAACDVYLFPRSYGKLSCVWKGGKKKYLEADVFYVGIYERNRCRNLKKDRRVIALLQSWFDCLLQNHNWNWFEKISGGGGGGGKIQTKGLLVIWNANTIKLFKMCSETSQGSSHLER